MCIFAHTNHVAAVSRKVQTPLEAAAQKCGVLSAAYVKLKRDAQLLLELNPTYLLPALIKSLSETHNILAVCCWALVMLSVVATARVGVVIFSANLLAANEVTRVMEMLN